MEKTKKYETKDLSKMETVGMIEISTFSSMAALLRMGLDTENVFLFKNKVDGIGSSLWAMLAMGARIYTENEVEEAEKMLELLQPQLASQIDELITLANLLKTGKACEKVSH